MPLNTHRSTTRACRGSSERTAAAARSAHPLAKTGHSFRSPCGPWIRSRHSHQWVPTIEPGSLAAEFTHHDTNNQAHDHCEREPVRGNPNGRPTTRPAETNFPSIITPWVIALQPFPFGVAREMAGRPKMQPRRADRLSTVAPLKYGFLPVAPMRTIAQSSTPTCRLHDRREPS